MNLPQQLWIMLCLPAILVQVLAVRYVFYETKVIQEVTTVSEAKAMEAPKEEAVDSRGDKLTCFFSQYNSLLTEHTDAFITTADAQGIDYRILPAISFIESTACKNYLTSTNNCWGWGHGRIVFNSIDSAINHIGERLAVSPYYREWQKDQEDYWKLAVVYNGGNQVKWHKDLLSTMDRIENCQ